MKKITGRQTGFTLVELILVVAIIGVLTAIAVPVYRNISGRVADNAHNANVRTIRGAVQMAVCLPLTPQREPYCGGQIAERGHLWQE